MKSNTCDPLKSPGPQSPSSEEAQFNQSINRDAPLAESEKRNQGPARVGAEGATGSVCLSTAISPAQEPFAAHFGPRGLRALIGDLKAADACVVQGLLNDAGKARLLVVHVPGRATHVVDLDVVGDVGELAGELRSKRVMMLTAAIPPSLLPDDVWDAQVVASTVFAGLVDNAPDLAESARLLNTAAPPALPLVSAYPKADEVREAVASARLGARFVQKLEDEVDALGLRETVRLDLKAHHVLRAATSAGILVDGGAWAEHTANCQAQERGLREALEYDLETKNLYDSEAVLEGLRRNGVDAVETSSDALAAYAGAGIVPELLRWRSVNAFLNDGARSIKDAIERSRDGRVRTAFNVHGTKTGRITTSEPNLLGLPRDVRRYFVPTPGQTFVYADFAACQLRILAEVTGDTGLRNVFARGGDPHQATAERLSRSGHIVDRERAKPINFGVPFGMKASGLVSHAHANFGVDFTREEAERYLKEYLASHPGVDRWQRAMARQVPRELRSISGRLRRYPVGNGNVRSRLASMIQMVEADAVKRALTTLAAELPPYKAQLALVFYDALLVECPERHASKVKDLVGSHMEAALACYLKSVPVVVQADVRRTWGG
ncbi:MAG: hypothetical protein K0R38_5365 [Polyangiaceae bacterium]|jgi:hypothetical protein|nr:hypothetical protein [Polyangiaceae bacterium]